MRNFLHWALIKSVGVLTIRRRDFKRNECCDKGKYSLDLCSEGTIHDAKNERVNGTAEEPQAGGKEENLKKKYNALFRHPK